MVLSLEAEPGRKSYEDTGSTFVGRGLAIRFLNVTFQSWLQHKLNLIRSRLTAAVTDRRQKGQKHCHDTGSSKPRHGSASEKCFSIHCLFRHFLISDRLSTPHASSLQLKSLFCSFLLPSTLQAADILSTTPTEIFFYKCDILFHPFHNIIGLLQYDKAVN